MGVNEIGVLLGPADGDQAEIVATPIDHMVQMAGDATSTLRRTTCSAPGESRFPFAKMCATFSAEPGYYTDLSVLPPETVFGVVVSLLQRGEAERERPSSSEALFYGLLARSGDFGSSPDSRHRLRTDGAHHAARRPRDVAVRDERAVAMSRSS